MCGRFTLFASPTSLAEEFGLPGTFSLEPRYNIAPSTPIAVVRTPPGGAGREAVLVRWGLIPSWAKAPAIGNRMINARAETAAEKPAFRTALRRRRCLVPADGFYEWKRTNGRKQPYFVRMGDGRTFAIGGIWETWEGADGPAVESCALLTTGPNDVLATIHDRMPVIVSRRDYDIWLSPEVTDPKAIAPLLCPYPAEGMAAFPVGTKVNNPSFDDPRCIEPL